MELGDLQIQLLVLSGQLLSTLRREVAGVIERLQS